jgi:hypothetical protein
LFTDSIFPKVLVQTSAKGHSFLVWYSIDREDQESESGFLCKKHFFVEKTVLIQSALGAVYLDTNSLLVADVK